MPVTSPALRRLAEAALGDYDLVGSLRLVSRRNNLIFRLTCAAGDFALRIHDPFNQGSGTLEQELAYVGSELTWLRALSRDTRLVLPRPVANRAGGLVTQVGVDGVEGARNCSLVAWVDGRFYDKGLRPWHLEQVGEMTAHLHDYSLSFVPPASFERGHPDGLDGPEGEAQFAPLHSEVEAAAAAVGGEFAAHSASAGDLVQRAIRRIWADLRELGAGREVYGLIHADIHQANYLFAGRAGRLIDFNNCGFAHYLYDFAPILHNLLDRPDYPALRAALLRGYQRVGRLPAAFDRYLNSLLALRSLSVAHWPLINPDHPYFAGKPQLDVARGLAEVARYMAGLFFPPPLCPSRAVAQRADVAADGGG